MPRRRVSRDDWLEAALRVLAVEGESGIRIERLARDLSVSKSGFYWHFADREALLQALLDHYDEQYVESVVRTVDATEDSPWEMLRRTAALVIDLDLGRYDPAMVVWASRDPRVKRRLARNLQRRVDYITNVLAATGLKGERLKLYGRMLAEHLTWLGQVGRFQSKSVRRGSMDALLDLIARESRRR